MAAEPTGRSPLTEIKTIRSTNAWLRQTAEDWRILRLAGDAPSFAV